MSLTGLGGLGGPWGAGRGRILGSYNRLTYTSSSISSESGGARGARGPWGAGRGRILGSYSRLTYTSPSISSESEGAGGLGRELGVQLLSTNTSLLLLYMM